MCLTFRDTSLIHPRTFIHPTKPHSEPRLHGRPSFQRREGRHGVDVARLSSTPRPRTRPCDTVIHLSFVGSVESRGLMVPPNMQIEGDGVREGGRLQRRTKRSKGTVARQAGRNEELRHLCRSSACRRSSVLGISSSSSAEGEIADVHCPPLSLSLRSSHAFYKSERKGFASSSIFPPVRPSVRPSPRTPISPPIDHIRSGSESAKAPTRPSTKPFRKSIKHCTALSLSTRQRHVRGVRPRSLVRQAMVGCSAARTRARQKEEEEN